MVFGLQVLITLAHHSSASEGWDAEADCFDHPGGEGGEPAEEPCRDEGGGVGSAGYNASMTLGGAALARPIMTTGVTAAGWLAAGLPLLVLGLGGKMGRLNRWGGGVLVAIYLIYLALLYL